MSKKTKPLETLQNYRAVAEQVKRIVKEIDPNAQIYVFGSVVKGKYTAASDIDILIITSRVDRKYDIMVQAYKAIDAPIQLHITTPQQYQKWYKRFINQQELTPI